MFEPDIKVPVTPNPIVESTEIILEPTDTVSKDFVFGTITKSPAISEVSSYPTNKPIL